MNVLTFQHIKPSRGGIIIDIIEAGVVYIRTKYSVSTPAVKVFVLVDDYYVGVNNKDAFYFLNFFL